jgi:hypothetical protein
VRVFEAKKCMGSQRAAALAGTLLDEYSFDTLVQDDATVLKPDGTPLLIYRKNVLDAKVCRGAYEALVAAAKPSKNRGMAAGVVAKRVQSKAGATTRTRIRPLKKDGTVSKTDESGVAVRSGIVGYYDRYDRTPYCRLTAFALEHPERFSAALPFVGQVDKIFASEVPDRYAAQKAIVAKTHPDFFIHGTAFTTITVNRNWQTAVHQDVGDYRPGFGVMAVLERGTYRGGFLVFPQYRVAVDMRMRGVCMANVHEWHGNTPIIGLKGAFDRVSCVFYYRENMYRCGSAAQELERAKNKQIGESRPRWG